MKHKNFVKLKKKLKIKLLLFFYQSNMTDFPGVSKILILQNLRKKEFLNLSIMNMKEGRFLNFFKPRTEELYDSNIFYCTINGSFREIPSFQILGKGVLFDFLGNFKEKISSQILEQELNRKKSGARLKSRLKSLFEEPESCMKNPVIQILNNTPVFKKIQKNGNIFHRKEQTKIFDIKSVEIFRFSIFHNFHRLFFFSNSFSFPFFSTGNLGQIKIFRNFNFALIKVEFHFSKLTSTMLVLPCQGLFFRKNSFSFLLFTRKFKKHIFCFFGKILIQILSNLSLFLYQPFENLLLIILPYGKEQRKGRKTIDDFPGVLNFQSFLNLTENIFRNKKNFLTKSFKWVFSSMQNYLLGLFRKIYFQKKERFLEKKKSFGDSFLNEIHPDSLKTNFFFHFENLWGILKTQNLIRTLTVETFRGFKKIIAFFFKKKSDTILFEEKIKCLLCRGKETIEFAINLENKKSKFEIALKVGKDQVGKNLLFSLFRQNRWIIDFPIRVKTTWEIVEISWTGKKGDFYSSFLTLFPRITSWDKNWNWICLQKDENWGKLYEIFFPFSTNILKAGFFFSELNKESRFFGIQTKKRKILNVIFSQIISNKNLIFDTKSKIRVTRNILLKKIYLKKNFLFEKKDIWYFNKILKKFQERTIFKKIGVYNNHKFSGTPSYQNKLLIKNLLLAETAMNWKKYELFFFRK